MDTEIIEKHFKEAVAAIEQGKPGAREVAAQFAQIILGTEALVVKKMATHAASTAHAPGEMYGGLNLIDNAVEELKDAEKYFAAYKATGDSRFLEMAKQELHHEYFLSQMAKEQGLTEDAASLDARRQQLERVIR